MQPSKTFAFGPGSVALRAAALALISALYFLGLGQGSLWDNSEPTYAEVAKELFKTGDWLTLHYNFQPWYIHPPLWIWTAGLAVKVFGLNEFAVRFPSALFGMLGAVATYAASRRLYGEVAGLVSALALATSLEYIVLSRLAILDSMLICFLTVATFWGYFALRDGDGRALWIAALAAALGTLTKGPVAVVIPLLTLSAWLVVGRLLVRGPASLDFARIRALPWRGAAIAYAVLAGSWFALETALHGSSFLAEYLGRSTFGRYLAPFENQPGPFYYYVPLLLLGFFPWIAFLPKALKEAWRARDNDSIFLLCASAVPFLFFSLAQTKLPNYLGIIFPALAVLVGGQLGRAIAHDDVRWLRGALLMLPAALVLLVIGIAIYVQTQSLGQVAELVAPLRLLGWIVVPTTIATGILTVALRRPWIAPLGLTATMAGIVAALVLVILPGLEARKPMKAMAAHIQSLWRPGDEIAITGVHGGFSLLFYTDAGPIHFLKTEDVDANAGRLLQGKARVYALIVPYEYGDLRQRGIKVRILERRPSMWLVTNR